MGVAHQIHRLTEALGQGFNTGGHGHKTLGGEGRTHPSRKEQENSEQEIINETENKPYLSVKMNLTIAFPHHCPGRNFSWGSATLSVKPFTVGDNRRISTTTAFESTYTSKMFIVKQHLAVRFVLTLSLD